WTARTRRTPPRPSVSKSRNRLDPDPIPRGHPPMRHGRPPRRTLEVVAGDASRNGAPPSRQPGRTRQAPCRPLFALVQFIKNDYCLAVPGRIVGAAADLSRERPNGDRTGTLRGVGAGAALVAGALRSVVLPLRSCLSGFRADGGHAPRRDRGIRG